MKLKLSRTFRHVQGMILLAGFTAMTLALFGSAQAEAQVKTKIGVLNDQSTIYSDTQGIGSVIAAQMAVEDYAKKLGVDAEVVTADHQNKADIGLGIARQWYDRDGVDVIMDLANSAVALAVNNLTKDRNKVMIASGAGTAELTGKQCTPNTISWTYDTWEAGHAFPKALVPRGNKKWFFITADYGFGHELEANASAELKALGAEVVGEVRAPVGTSDFASFLLQAQSSNADTIAMANAGADLSNALKQAAEFGLSQQFHLLGFVLGLNHIHSLGLKASQGVMAVLPFYWDQDDASRAFAHRFQARHPRQLMPNDMQAGVYSATVHYLKAVAALKSASDGAAVVAKMKEMPTDDPLFGKGTIRIDGRKIHPVKLYETKKPSESKGDWDYFKLITTIPGDQAFRPLSAGGCYLAANH